MANPNSHRRFRRLRDIVKAQRRPCCICLQPIDYTLRYPDPQSFSVEHLKPQATHPHLAEQLANLDAAHLRCNTARRKQDTTPRLGQRSRYW